MRYRAAVAAFRLWDDLSKEWGDVHDTKSEELKDKYQVFGSLIPETRWEILETQTSCRPPWYRVDNAPPAA